MKTINLNRNLKGNLMKTKQFILSHLRTIFCALAITGVSLVSTSMPASSATFVETVSDLCPAH
jgi:hypothetical protein